ncbi:MAG TPA: peptidoglycan-binding domain-containing protein [Candidatus Nanoarchaeia archaeon]|nr:peptidoglycan-binding domain-containing protein [Candidatus Nanoarchaeia archaeon]
MVTLLRAGLGTTIVGLLGIIGSITSSADKVRVNPEKMTVHAVPEKEYIDKFHVLALKDVESGKPSDTRYEPCLDKVHGHLEDTSYGSFQFLPVRALDLQSEFSSLPRLWKTRGKKEQEVIASLRNDTIAAQYAFANLRRFEELYQSVDVALAAHNTGYAPRHARDQQRLNDLQQVVADPVWPLLRLDGDIGSKTKTAVAAFEHHFGLPVDSVLDEDTHNALRRVWSHYYPNVTDLVGLIPQNGITPGYVVRVKNLAKKLRRAQ